MGAISERSMLAPQRGGSERARGSYVAGEQLRASCVAFADWEALRLEWMALSAALGPMHPSTSLPWTRAWATFLDAQARPTHASLRLYVVRRRDGSACAIIPCTSRSILRFGVPWARWVETGIESFSTQASALLVDPRVQEDVVRVLVELLASEGHDLILLRGLRSSNEALARIAALPGAMLEPETSVLRITPPSDWRLVQAPLSRKMRRTLRHDYAALKAADENFRFHVAAMPNDLEAGIEKFLALFSLSLEGRRSPLQKAFAAPQAGALLRSILTERAAAGSLRIFSLEVARAVVAMRIAFVADNVLYLHLHADDPATRKKGALTVTMAEILKYAVSQRLSAVQLSTGRPRSCLRWKPEEQHLGNVAIWRPGVRGLLVRTMRRARRYAVAASHRVHGLVAAH